MSNTNLTSMVSDVARRMLQVQEKMKEEEENVGMETLKNYLDPKTLQTLLDEVKRRLHARRYNTLNWDLAECQGMLQEFEASNRKLAEDIKLIREIIADMRERINDLIDREMECSSSEDDEYQHEDDEEDDHEHEDDDESEGKRESEHEHDDKTKDKPEDKPEDKPDEHDNEHANIDEPDVEHKEEHEQEDVHEHKDEPELAHELDHENEN